MTVLELRTVIDASPARCFDLALDVNQHTASMAGSQESVVGGVSLSSLTLGDQVTWRARHLGRWWTMRVEIVVHDRPARFVDEMVEGPFASFRHEHRFVPLAAGHTEMVDVVQYEPPLGGLGRLVDALIIHQYLYGLLQQRNTHLQRSA